MFIILRKKNPESHILEFEFPVAEKPILFEFRASVEGIKYCRPIDSSRYYYPRWISSIKEDSEDNPYKLPTITGTNSKATIDLFVQNFYSRTGGSLNDRNDEHISFSINDPQEFFPNDENPLGKEYDFILEINAEETNIVKFNLKRKQ